LPLEGRATKSGIYTNVGGTKAVAKRGTGGLLSVSLPLKKLTVAKQSPLLQSTAFQSFLHFDLQSELETVSKLTLTR
jgi:hypothetical protein